MRKILNLKHTFNMITYYILWLLNIGFRAGLRYLLGRTRRDLLLSRIRYVSPSRWFSERYNMEFLSKLPWGVFLSTVERSIGFKETEPSTWHEPEVYPWINLEEGDVAFDIGTHHGWYTLLFSRKVGDMGQVLAIEPNPNNLCFIQKNIQLNQLLNVKVLPYALSNKSGHTKLSIGAHSGGHTIMRLSGRKRGAIFTSRAITVPTKTLDNLLQGFDEVKLIKIDVEGAELNILKSCKQLRKVRRFIVEVHRREYLSSLRALFENKGFKVKKLKEKRLIATRYYRD